MDADDCEALAQSALDESGLNDRPNVDPLVLAVAWGGLRVRPEPHCTPHLIDGVIVYRAGASDDAIAWAAAHELSHAMIEWAGVKLERSHEERCANRIASALLLPRRPFLRDLACGDLDHVASLWPLATPWVLARRITEVRADTSAALWTRAGRRALRRAGYAHEPHDATATWETSAGTITFVVR